MKTIKTLLFFLTLPVIVIGILSMSYASGRAVKVTLTPVNGALMTSIIQDAIDSCGTAGGGTVIFTAGTYLSGGLQLKSNVSLHLEKGALLQGSDKYSDYNNDAFIFGKDIKDITIKGEGIIDGVDCYNPKGEEGFRGPHCIRLIKCTGITIKDVTIINSANWAINCRYCSGGMVDKVSIRAGHDGLHSRFCSDFVVTDCDFRTGDDAFAGNDNRNFKISGCKINTSCNGFRFGCQNLTVRNCTMWGPGEFIHKSQSRTNMLSAFVHFSPKDENPQLSSGNWLIENITVKNVDQFYNYNFENGLWQTGHPVTDISFSNISASGLIKAFSINGGTDRQLKLTVSRSDFAYREGISAKGESFEGAKSRTNSFFSAVNFGIIELNKITLNKTDSEPILTCKNGNTLIVKSIKLLPPSASDQSLFENIGEIK